MPSLKDLRKRIESVKSTQQITKAMKLVAAAKLRQAQERLLQMRPYARGVHEMIAHVAARSETQAHPLLAQREQKRAQLLVLTSDRGLCGAFNTNVIKRAHAYLDSTIPDVDVRRVEHEHTELALIGRKGIEYFGKRDYPIRERHLEVLTQPTLERASQIGEEVVADFIDENLDAVYIVYNEFKSAISQRIVVEQLLPIVPAEPESGDSAVDFRYEPTKEAILDALLPMYVNVELYRAVMESLASEMGARMTAMENATRNATELIASLTLTYNRARQSAITTELMEIVGGAEALKQS